MRRDGDGFIVTPDELGALVASLVDGGGPLASQPPGGPAPDLSALGDGARSQLENVVAILGDPARRIRMRASVGADRVLDQVLATSEAGSVLMTVRTGEVRIGAAEPGVLSELAGDILGVDEDLAADPEAYRLDGTATLVFLAFVEELAAMRVAAAVMRRSSPGLVTRDAIIRRLTAPHPPYPLGFLTSVLPVALPEAVSKDDVVEALAELEAAELVEGIAGTSISEATPEGLDLADRLLMDGSKVALGVSKVVDGAAVHEAILLVRSPRSITMAAVSGAAGVLATPSGAEVASLLATTLGGSRRERGEPPPPPPPEDEDGRAHPPPE